MKFTMDPKVRSRDIDITSVDEIFLQKAMDVVEKYLSDSDFGVDLFAQEVGMSSSNLNRKLKALTDKTTNQFIRTLRLTRAQQLLLKGKYRISEAAYAVGFTDTSYFTKCFSKEFGVSPTQYVASNLIEPN
jgi:AraC-like DNA-binding protein